ncbi:M15 family metallopeptidase [Candidatus Methylospira mobilis]|uniref:M15 family metallopeptidase n=1 Tax=Candidatus Methylospira mobilis TaxID=1808979 RepID=UPI0028ED53B6|nr:M15 family metallopeptidase [Candidatus Methylospira mobilis]WNV06584.1 M15 family metallopeptidase [Candidatus Methylospira mobilis]
MPLERPPLEHGGFRAPELVELINLESGLRLDIRYATANNFVGYPVYSEARAFLQKPAAEALIRVHRKLGAQGYGLMIYDGYRPWSVTKIFWDAVSGPKRQFVADPAQGSRHNRGCAVDLTLYELITGQAVAMPTDYDEMTQRAYFDYPGGTPESMALREILKAAMTSEGFTVHPREWWHYDYQDWQSYGILDVPFSAVAGR